MMSLDGEFAATIGGISAIVDLAYLEGEVTNQPPTAEIEPVADPYTCIPEPGHPGFTSVELDGSNSLDADNDIAAYFWNVDEGDQFKTGSQVDVLLDPGEHHVRLTVVDGLGIWSFAEQTFEVVDYNGLCP